MNDDHPSPPATRARSPRTVVLLGVVIASLVGCSTGGGAGDDSVVALEQARAEAAAELAEVQEALDRQVEAADAQKAEAQSVAEQPPAPAAAAVAPKPAADRAAAPGVAPAGATSRRAAAPRAAAVTRVTAPRAAAVRRPAQRTTGKSPQSTPGASGGAGQRATAPVAPPKPVAARPLGAAAAPKPPRPEAAAATTPTTPPQGAVSSTDDLSIVIAAGGTSSAPGGASAAAVCEPQDFQTGDRVLLTTVAGLVVREAVLPACQPDVLAGPGAQAAPGSPRFSVTLPEIAWRDGDAWVLQIGSRQWPVTASTLSEHGWSIAVSAEGAVVAGPVERHCGEQELPEPPAWAVTLAGDGTAKPSTAPVTNGSLSCSAGSSPASAGGPAAAQ